VRFALQAPSHGEEHGGCQQHAEDVVPSPSSPIAQGATIRGDGNRDPMIARTVEDAVRA
jgi:hypothetical protein